MTDSPTTPSTRPFRWWLAVIIFVGGLVLGVVLVGLLRATTPEFGSVSGGQQPAAPTPGGGVPVVARAEVNAACLRVINEAQDVAAILAGLNQASTDVDFQQLDDIVRQLQPIEPRLRRDLNECRVDAGVAGGGESSPTPSSTLTPPTPSPTG